MHHPPLAERDPHVRRLPVVAIAEEREVRGVELLERPRVPSDLELLPRIARELDAMKPEDALAEARAVGAPGSDSAPEIRRSLEKLLRRTRDRHGGGRKAGREVRLVHHITAFECFFRC